MIERSAVGSAAAVARAAAVVIAAMVLAVGCSASSEQSDEATSTTSFEAKPVVNLVVSNWTASALNAALAEQLIERHLGYPVEAVRLDDTTAIYDGLAAGTLDANLEIWPSDMTDRDRLYFDRGEVLDIGPLGPVGKVGWFVPRYVVEGEPTLATWEGFLDPEAAAIFATAETRPKGRLLGTNADYLQYDEAIIANLGLPLEVVFSGTEAASLSELASRVEAKEPILLYWWTPTAAVATYDLVNVTLPARTEACQEATASGGSGVDCDYPEDPLFKATSPGLAGKAPDIDAFLRAFTLSNDDQAGLLAAVEIDGATIDAAAADWIAANEATWRAWLPGEGGEGEGGDGDDGS